MPNELTRQKAAYVKALRMYNHKQHDIAALFGVNPRAVSHIINYQVYVDVAPDYSYDIPRHYITTPKIDLIRELEALKKSGR